MANRPIAIEVALGAFPHELLGHLGRADTEETWRSLPRVRIEAAPEESLASVVSRALALFPEAPDWIAGWLELHGGANHPFQFYRGDGTPLTGSRLGPLVDDLGRIVWRVHDPALVTVAMLVRSHEEGVLRGSPTRLYIAGAPTAGGPEAVWGPLLETWEVTRAVAGDLAILYTASQALRALISRLRRGKAAAERLVYTPAQAVIALIRARDWDAKHLAKLLGVGPEDARALIELISPARADMAPAEAAFLESLTDSALTLYFHGELDREALGNILRVALVDLAEGRPPPTVDHLPTHTRTPEESVLGEDLLYEKRDSAGHDSEPPARRGWQAVATWAQRVGRKVLRRRNNPP